LPLARPERSGREPRVRFGSAKDPLRSEAAATGETLRGQLKSTEFWRTLQQNRSVSAAQAVFGKLPIERTASDAEPARRLGRVAAGLVEGAGKGAAFIGFERERHIQRHPRGGPRRAASREGEITGAQAGSASKRQSGLHHVFELAYV